MSNKEYILVHDLGTTGNKAVLFDNEGNISASEYIRFETYYPQPLFFEQKPEEWWKAVVNSTKSVLNKAQIKSNDVVAVSLVGQQIGAIPVDKQGNLLRENVLIWCDARSTKQAADLVKKIGSYEAFYNIHGLGHTIETLSVCKVMWIKENEPEIYKKTYKFLQSKDFILLRLTDNKVFVDDYTDASNTGWLDIKKRKYSDQILEAADIDIEKLPELHESREIIGYVGPKASEETSLKVGTPIILGSGDVPASCAGAALEENKKSFMYIGSANWGGVRTSEPCLNAKFRLNNVLHPWKGYVVFSTTTSGGISLDWARKIFCELEDKIAKAANINIYDIINLKVKSIPPGSSGILFLPYLRGGGGPHWDPFARGTFLGLTLASTKEEILRAVMEGVALNFRWLMEQFEQLGIKIFDWNEINACGGGVLNTQWISIYADVLGIKIIVHKMPQEVTALGSFLIAATSIGWFNDFEEAKNNVLRIDNIIYPNRSSKKLYDKLYNSFKDAYEKLIPIYKNYQKDF
ncbi:MAG: FGGY-family carbohydrate kinase [Candidatus Aenigmatarchaeota archaeon]